MTATISATSANQWPRWSRKKNSGPREVTLRMKSSFNQIRPRDSQSRYRNVVPGNPALASEGSGRGREVAGQKRLHREKQFASGTLWWNYLRPTVPQGLAN